jgi:hypothetical protein
MLKLERIENKVYYNGVELKINKQASKGPGNEVVYVKDCPEANGQTWVSLSRLQEGINELECKQRNVTSHAKYTLTVEEQNRINELQREIDEIRENAKKRYVEKPNFNIDITKLSDEEKLAHIDIVKKYLASLNA